MVFPWDFYSFNTILKKVFWKKNRKVDFELGLNLFTPTNKTKIVEVGGVVQLEDVLLEK